MIFFKLVNYPVICVSLIRIILNHCLPNAVSPSCSQEIPPIARIVQGEGCDRSRVSRARFRATRIHIYLPYIGTGLEILYCR